MAEVLQPVRDGVATLFAELSELVETVELRVDAGASAYDPQTGAVSRTQDVQRIPAIFTSFRHVDGETVRMDDLQMVVKAADVSVRFPTDIADGTIVRGADSYAVVEVMPDPTRTVYTVHLRRAA